MIQWQRQCLMHKPHRKPCLKSKTGDISKQSPSPLHHTFLLGRARFTAQLLSALVQSVDEYVRTYAWSIMWQPNEKRLTMFYEYGAVSGSPAINFSESWNYSERLACEIRLLLPWLCTTNSVKRELEHSSRTLVNLPRRRSYTFVTQSFLPHERGAWTSAWKARHWFA